MKILKNEEIKTFDQEPIPKAGEERALSVVDVIIACIQACSGAKDIDDLISLGNKLAALDNSDEIELTIEEHAMAYSVVNFFGKSAYTDFVIGQTLKLIKSAENV